MTEELSKAILVLETWMEQTATKSFFPDLIKEIKIIIKYARKEK